MTNNREEQIYKAADKATYQTPPQYSELVHKSRKAMCAYEVGFIDGCVWADSHPQWIPVEERLPEHCDCLLYTEPRNIHGPFEGRFRFGFYNYADQRWEIQGEKWDNTIVTHWMPIVPPRKEE